MGLTADLGLYNVNLSEVREEACGGVVRVVVIHVDGFAMRVDDWEVTRPRVTTAH